MSTIEESHLSNSDLAPTGPERRTWDTDNLAALWIGLSIVIKYGIPFPVLLRSSFGIRGANVAAMEPATAPAD
jgi:NCS1 family nucleobase:cation symporter-1